MSMGAGRYHQYLQRTLPGARIPYNPYPGVDARTFRQRGVIAVVFGTDLMLKDLGLAPKRPGMPSNRLILEHWHSSLYHPSVNPGPWRPGLFRDQSNFTTRR